MNVSFKVHREMPPAEQKALFEWGPDIFGGSLYNLQWRGTDYHVVGYVDGEPVTHVGIVKHSVSVGASSRVVGGVGAVVTVPRRQKKGLAQMCLRRAGEYMRSDLNVAFGFLFCPERLVHFYAAGGWRKLNEKVIVNQPGGTIVAPLCSMVLEFSERWPEGPVNLESLPW